MAAAPEDSEERQWRVAVIVLSVALALFGVALLTGAAVQLVIADRDHDQLQGTGQAMPGVVGPQLPVASKEWNRVVIGYTVAGERREVETLCPLSGCPRPGTETTLWFDSADSSHWTSGFGQGSDSESVRRSQVLMPVLGAAFLLIALPGYVWVRRERRESQRQAAISAARVERIRAERMRRRKR